MESDLGWGAYQPGHRRTAASLKGQNGGRKAENGGKNPYKYGSITKVPEFFLERDFIKHTPYAERPKENDIPFWTKLPLHLEYLLKDKDMLEHVLAFMYRTQQFQGILGEAAFYHQNPGFDVTVGDREILADHNITSMRASLTGGKSTLRCQDNAILPIGVTTGRGLVGGSTTSTTCVAALSATRVTCRGGESAEHGSPIV
jgi:hypothetical protein